MQRNATIDSYNGIMLCKRPTSNNNDTLFTKQKNCKTHSHQHPVMIKSDKTLHNNHTSPNNINKNNEQGSFLCGTVPTPWGNNTGTRIKSEKNKVLSRLSKNDGALSRHKQWLKEMQEKRDREMKEKEEEARLKKEKDRQFMERQARRRQKLRQLENDDMKGDMDECDYMCERSAEHGERSGENLNLKLKSGEKRCRPVWSLTESEAKDVDDCMKAEEEEKLIEFVDGLNFEQYFDDMELKVLMTQVKDRINQLEKQKHHDQSRLDTVLQSEISSAHNAKYNNENILNESNIHPKDMDSYSYRRHANDDIHSIAETVRSCGDASIASIHSRKSMQMLVSQARDRLGSSTKELHTINEEKRDYGEMNMRAPVTITHTEDNGARLAETKSLNKLPFKNRNPAL